MPDEGTHSGRKADHLRINIEEKVQFTSTTNGFESYRLIHQALPEIDLQSVDLKLSFLGCALKAPLLVSSMTGGAEEAERINRNLAIAAQSAGIAMGVGSQRAAVQNSELSRTYSVRDLAPDVLLFANLGAVQLNYGYGVEQCRRAVDMIGADALILHLNPIQEAVQPAGNTNWSNLLPKIETVCQTLGVPVVVKEVGFGISADVATRLANAGVAAIDVAGAGGTSWAAVEARRAKSPAQRALAESFWNWGIPTAESLVRAREAAPGVSLIASGGIRDGIEVAKAIALGATLVGIASPLLKAANTSIEATAETLMALQMELRVAMFGIGARTLDELSHTRFIERIG